VTISIRSFVTLALLAAPFTALAQDPNAAQGPQPPAVNWVEGPGKGQIGSMAVINIPQGYRFCGAADTQKLMKFMQNPVSGNELGFFASDTADWFIVFEFNEIGYVKDDEKDELDANAILSSLREGNERGNETRRSNGWPTLEIVGWEVPPKYDSVTNNLEWAIKLRDSGGGENVNFNTRLLGRKGVMEAALVIDTQSLAATLPEFKTLLGGYSFIEGETYASYRQGDKIAEYGLTALVTGGAVAVAAKSGLLAKLLKGGWKILVVVGVAIAGVFKKIFGKKDE
jgi:uncharacterized membrane-anchored protein